MGSFDGQTAIVTGAAQGIGAAVADLLAARGARVVVADINEKGGAAMAASLGEPSFAVPTDVGDEASVAALHEEVVSRTGRIDVLVNNAAIVPFTAWDDVDFAEWRRIMRVNLDGVYLMCRAASAQMRTRGYGRIVNIASNTFFAGTPNMAAYVAAKGGVVGFTRALATELGGTASPSTRSAPASPRRRGCWTARTPRRSASSRRSRRSSGRAVPGDIAPAVAFLASEEAGWITGSTVNVDGGHVRH